MQKVRRTMKGRVRAILGVAVVAFALPLPADAGNIIIHIANTTDADRVEAANNIKALLETASHTVTVSTQYANHSLTQQDRTALSQYDLMIFPRLAGSATTWDDAHGWPTVDVPMLISSGLIAADWGLGEHQRYRRNTALGDPSLFRGVNRQHPLFAGVTFDSNGNITIGPAPTNELRPIRPTAGTPPFTQLLTAAYGTDGTALADDPTLSSLAVWEPGSIPGITARRIFFDLQTEDDLNVGAANNMDALSADMRQIYLNAVQYTIPEPASLMLVGAGVGMMLLRRRV